MFPHAFSFTCRACGSDLDPPRHAFAIKDLECVLGGGNAFVQSKSDIEAFKLFMVDKQLHAFDTSNFLLCEIDNKTKAG